MSHLRTKALRNRVNELLSEYEISEIMNALWSEVDSMRISLSEDKETYHNQDQRNELSKKEKESDILFHTWNTISHLVL